MVCGFWYPYINFIKSLAVVWKIVAINGLNLENLIKPVNKKTQTQAITSVDRIQTSAVNPL